ncbi:MAG: monomethylamine:corrinoid methyltransferase, partial [Leptolinea sp.]
IYQILDRAHNGEFCTAKEWDIKKISGTIRRILKDHKLEKTCDPNNPVNFDYDLADRFYQAGFQAALELGYFCEDTERIIKVSQEELENALKFAPSEIFFGEGKDGTLIKSRTPGDPFTCKVACSLGITVSEDIAMQVLTGIAAEPEVDILEGITLTTIRGHQVLTGTPWETLMNYEYARMHREARRKAGRPGMAGWGSISATTEYGQFGAYGTPGGFSPATDLALILYPSEMKVDYRTLNKVVHTLNMGGMVKADSPSMIGGMPGPAEGATICEIACSILSYAILQNSAGGGQMYDVRYLSNVNREGLWALSVVNQALSRNTHTLPVNIANIVSGPVTENVLYEIAAGQATLACSGASATVGPRTAGGKLNDYITPLECRFTAEVTHASSGLDPKKANDIVKELVTRYEGKLKDPDMGKPYQQAYDVNTSQPMQEWESLYRRIKHEVIELGIPMDEF